MWIDTNCHLDAPEFEADVVHKWAAVEKTHAFTSKPQISLFSPRLLVLLLLLLIGLLLRPRNANLPSGAVP